MTGGLGLGRKVVPHLGHLRLDLRQRRVRVEVQFEMYRDRAHALGAEGLE